MTHTNRSEEPATTFMAMPWGVALSFDGAGGPATVRALDREGRPDPALTPGGLPPLPTDVLSMCADVICSARVAAGLSVQVLLDLDFDTAAWGMMIPRQTAGADGALIKLDDPYLHADWGNRRLAGSVREVVPSRHEASWGPTPLNDGLHIGIEMQYGTSGGCGCLRVGGRLLDAPLERVTHNATLELVLGLIEAGHIHTEPH